MPQVSGTLAYSSDRDGDFEVFEMSVDGGTVRQLTDRPDTDGYPAWSPDAGKIAFYAYHGVSTWSIQVMDADGGDRRRLTTQVGAQDYAPVWSPDGGSIAFSRFVDGSDEVWLMQPDGSGQVRLAENCFGLAWHPDGTRVAMACKEEDNWDIYATELKDSSRERLTRHYTMDSWPNWSPDGERLVFQSWRDGNSEIYVMSADGSAQRRLTYDGAYDAGPVWSPDGMWILFSTLEGEDWELFVMGAGGFPRLRLTDNAAQDYQAAWRPARIGEAAVLPRSAR